MTRITAGRWRGRPLVTPKGDLTRPTSDKVRGAIGNALAATGGLDGAAVLDLYAGSGALGLELLSRGAARVVFVERARSAGAAIRANLDRLGADGALLVLGEVAAFAAGQGEPFDIVLADPPYAEPDDAIGSVLAALHAAGRLRPAADLVVERPARAGEIDWPAPLQAVRSRRYGDTLVCYGRAP